MYWLSIIMDFDCILVLDNKIIVEFGYLRDLIEILNRVFWDIVDEDIERKKLIEIIYS